MKVMYGQKEVVDYELISKEGKSYWLNCCKYDKISYLSSGDLFIEIGSALIDYRIIKDILNGSIKSIERVSQIVNADSNHSEFFIEYFYDIQSIKMSYSTSSKGNPATYHFGIVAKYSKNSYDTTKISYELNGEPQKLIKVIDFRATGKTTRLLCLAKEYDAYLVCNKKYVKDCIIPKLGITYDKLIDYEEFDNENIKGCFFVDELGYHLDSIDKDHPKLLGFSHSLEGLEVE